MIVIDLQRLFESEKGKAVYSDFLRIIDDFSMRDRLEKGIIVGFSGGADSVMLLCALVKFSKENQLPMPIAVHLNHGIRGEEALRDEKFSKQFSKALGVEYISFKRDIPNEARKICKGLEETARIIRYSIFEDIISGRNDVSAVAVAHNSTDNLETVIFNMMRGAGTRGLCGIAPVRGNIIRPILYSSKRDIVSALESAQIPFVVDSTNFETDYRRNYIRAEILPKFRVLSDNPEAQAIKTSLALRQDEEFIESMALDFLSDCNDVVSSDRLMMLDEALFYRVVSLMAKKKGASLEFVHVKKIKELILSGKNNFSVSLPSGVSFISKDKICYVDQLRDSCDIKYEKILEFGVNHIDEIDAEIVLSREPIVYSSNVYKIAIQECIDFDIIEGGLFVREKRDGDSYVYGGKTRKLKKLFNDASLSVEKRRYVPVFCDSKGIVYVPGFRVRDGGDKKSSNKVYVTVAYKNNFLQ